MGKHERQTYLKAIRSRYWRAGKMAKVTILDEFCAVCGYHRKYAIRLLNQRGKPRIKRMPGRKPIYGSPELLAALKRIWFASDQICSKKLKAGHSTVATLLWDALQGADARNAGHVTHGQCCHY